MYQLKHEVAWLDSNQKIRRRSMSHVKLLLESTHCIACCRPHIEVFEELWWTAILASYLFPNLCCHSPVKERVKQKEEAGEWHHISEILQLKRAWLMTANQDGWPIDPRGDSIMVNRESIWSHIIIWHWNQHQKAMLEEILYNIVKKKNWKVSWQRKHSTATILYKNYILNDELCL